MLKKILKQLKQIKSKKIVMGKYKKLIELAGDDYILNGFLRDTTYYHHSNKVRYIGKSFTVAMGLVKDGKVVYYTDEVPITVKSDIYVVFEKLKKSLDKFEQEYELHRNRTS